MKRREFLRGLSLWSAGLLAAPPIFRFHSSAIAAGEPTRLVVAHGKDYAALTARVLEPLGGLGAFLPPKARVVIKPNIGWDRRPEQAANTHPEVVKSLILQALQAGADRVTVFDNTCNDERRCYATSGIREAVESVGDRRARWEYIDSRKFVPVKIPRGRNLTEWSFYKEALEADCYINVPVAKHHSLSGLSLGLKNVMGVIGGNRGRIHHEIGQNLADLATVLKPTLNVVDATRILLRHGPVGGRLEDVRVMDTLIASTDIVAVDAYATTLFDKPADALESTRAAAAMGLGQMDLNQVDVRRVDLS